MSPEARIVLDCRWLGISGAGRATELLLGELGAAKPRGRWLLWGRPDRVAPFVFEGSTVVASASDPRALKGQRDLFRIPEGDVVIYLHQIRPLRPGPSITLIHDTIQLRYGSRVARVARRAFLRASARLSSFILTPSELSRERIIGDLGIPPERVIRVRYPVDMKRAGRIAELRAQMPQQDVLLYVGRFAPHKNLPRLVEAFSASEFARAGGRLVLAGGNGRGLEEVRRLVAGRSNIEVVESPSDDQLEQLLATSRALIVPSVEEGYGLPAFEAAASGLPVAASRTGAMTELPASAVVVFDPRDVAAMRGAIDDSADREPQEARKIGPPSLRESVLAHISMIISAEHGSKTEPTPP